MKITEIKEECGDIIVDTTMGKFCVQLVDGIYRSDLGCLLTDYISGDDVDENDYPEICFGEIIEAAEKFYEKDFANRYTEREIEFHCSINAAVVVMRVEKDSKMAELIIKDCGYIGDYQAKYSAKLGFEDVSDAERYADKFRTGDYQDCSGLYALMQSIQQSTVRG